MPASPRSASTPASPETSDSAPSDLREVRAPAERTSPMTRFADSDQVVIAGAGPAGLSAAYELARLGCPGVVLEQGVQVGGLSRTVESRGYRFDIGGHRFFTKHGEIEEIWHDLLGDDLLERPRLSRILYRGTFFDYPLKPLNALAGLGPWETLRVTASYLKVRLRPLAREETFEQWVTNRFGRRLFEIFFETYTEKVWGMPCSQISADWAAQRIKNLDLASAIRSALTGGRARDGEVITTLIDRFLYPRLGPGMMWEACRRRAEEGGVATRLETRLVALRHDRGRVREAVVRGPDGTHEVVPGAAFISSIPLPELVGCLQPAAPAPVLAAAGRLRHRDFLTVVLVVDRRELFPDNWIYVHSPEVRVGRIQNYKNWSPEMVPDPATTSLGLEYFVNRDEQLWSRPDDELLALGERECRRLGLLHGGRVLHGFVLRVPAAYPVYDDGYREAVATVREYLETLTNLQTIGRNGQHRYNNQDHSMLTGLYAARNAAAGEPIHDACVPDTETGEWDEWDVNVDRRYLETGGTSERSVPRRVGSSEASAPAADG